MNDLGLRGIGGFLVSLASYCTVPSYKMLADYVPSRYGGSQRGAEGMLFLSYHAKRSAMMPELHRGEMELILRCNRPAFTG